ncbi:asparagine synthase-related protein [Sphingomonas lenta]|uniref:Asparagine synthetase domain-containing protein n=1 Tax=Sphingomonas lenta TaxID=1141887 RepID=A0A2A2SKP0_9SPHN|nr:asparagine synthase-related protein [Sphingomonas lenta]PAX09720.1 hypothetical protein CKY28_03035 [Sphingomonas lenta]
MGALFVTRDGDAALASARAGFSRQGFTDFTELAIPGWRALHMPYIVGGPDLLLRDGDDFAAVAGTLVADGRTGRPALDALMRMMDDGTPDWSRLGGQFAALVRRRGRSFLFCDWFAHFQLFRDSDDRLFSTSLLAAAELLPRLSFDAQGVYEFAFNVTALGDDTVLEQVKLLGPDVMLELTPDGVVRHPLSKPLPEPAPLTPAERLDRHRAALDEVLAPHLRDDAHVHCPLSGGLDSRLLLAAVRRLGADPSVYVYGPPGSADVRVARAVGDALGFAVEWIDKQAAPIAPDAFPAMVAHNFHENDGMPTFGNIFDNGGHLRARDARHAHGWPIASGGGGEVYRDFFYLPDRPFGAEAVARTFFARFLRTDATELFDPRLFIERIRDKILDALGRPGDRAPLPRSVVEQIYPRFRCRALFGREISLEARHSPYLLPFLEPRVVAETAELPPALRRAGRFEAQLLHAIDPELAAQPSAYGHHFAGPPSRRHRLQEWSSRVRPVWLRQRSYALHRRRGPVTDEHGGLLDPDYLGRVIDLDYPAMRRFFHVERVADHGLLRRIACLEYLAAQLGSRLSG